MTFREAITLSKKFTETLLKNNKLSNFLLHKCAYKILKYILILENL